MIFDEKEAMARRQFHELFCTKYLYTGERKGALNEDSWTADTLYDIVRSVYPENPLTPADIETILQLGGMYDSHQQLFFHYRVETPMLEPILAAIAPFVPTKTFVMGKQKMNGRAWDSVAEFVQKCCNNVLVPYQKVILAELYSHYCTWCSVNDFLAVNKRLFYRKMETMGFPKKKGYLNKTSGMGYFLVRFDVREVNKDAKQATAPEGPKEIETLEDTAEPIRDDYRGGKKIPEFTLLGRPSEISSEQKTYDIKPISAGSNGTSSGDGFDDEQGDPYLADDDTDAAEDAFYDDSGELEEPTVDSTGFDPVAESSAGVRLQAQQGVRALSTEIRSRFKLMKVTYRVAPDHFSKEDFKFGMADIMMGASDAELQDLYQVFLEYAK